MIVDVRAAAIPHPMSTPTAAGTMAPRVGITLPTVAPSPQWTSGMAATHLKMKGRLAALRSCRAASSSKGTPRTQALMGARSVSMRTYGGSAMPLE